MRICPFNGCSDFIPFRRIKPDAIFAFSGIWINNGYAPPPENESFYSKPGRIPKNPPCGRGALGLIFELAKGGGVETRQ
jgi:hypothetical protein